MKADCSKPGSVPLLAFVLTGHAMGFWVMLSPPTSTVRHWMWLAEIGLGSAACAVLLRYLAAGVLQSPPPLALQPLHPLQPILAPEAKSPPWVWKVSAVGVVLGMVVLLARVTDMVLQSHWSGLGMASTMLALNLSLTAQLWRQRGR